MKKLILFTLNGCSHCNSLKNRLNDIGIGYIDVDVDENQSVWDLVVKEINYEYFPTVLITHEDDDEGTIYVPSVDYKTEDEIIEIITKKIKEG